MGTGSMLERQVLVLLMFFLVVLIVIIFKFSVMFGNKNEQVVAILFFVECRMFQEFIQLHNISKI